MRPAQYPPEAIIQAGKEIRDSGRAVTGFGIRNKLGGGNTKRLEEEWKKYVESEDGLREQEEESEGPSTLPPQLHESCDAAKKTLASYVDGLYLQAYRLVETDLSQRYKRDFEQLKRQEADNAAALEDAAKAVENTDRKLDEITGERDNLQILVQEFKDALKKTERDLELADKNHKASQQTVGDLGKTLSRFKKSLADAQLKEAATEARLKEMNNLLGRLDYDVKVAQDKAANATEAASNLTTQNEILKSKLQHVKDTADAEVARLNKELTEGKATIKDLQVTITERDTKASNLQAEVRAAGVEIEGLKALVAELKAHQVPTSDPALTASDAQSAEQASPATN
jgi:colicin import membrane protein